MMTWMCTCAHPVSAHSLMTGARTHCLWTGCLCDQYTDDEVKMATCGECDTYGPCYTACSKPTLAAHKSEGKAQVGDMDANFILEMGAILTQGLSKYPNDPDGMPNWYKGGSYRSFCASILRHALKLAAGEDIDAESGLPHAAHIAIDAMFVRSWQSRGVGVDDRLKEPS